MVGKKDRKLHWKPQVSWLFKKFQLYLASVFDSSITVEMPEELSTFDSTQASLAVSQPGNGGSWFCLMPTAGYAGSHRGGREGSCPHLSWVSASKCPSSSCNRAHATTETRSPCLTKQFERHAWSWPQRHEVRVTTSSLTLPLPTWGQ